MEMGVRPRQSKHQPLRRCMSRLGDIWHCFTFYSSKRLNFVPNQSIFT